MLRYSHAALFAAIAVSAACAKRADESAARTDSASAPAVAATPLTGDSAAPAAATPPATATDSAAHSSTAATSHPDSARSRTAATAAPTSTRPAAATARSTAPVTANASAKAAPGAPARPAPAVAVTRSTSPVAATPTGTSAKAAPAPAAASAAATPTPTATKSEPVRVNQFMSYDAGAKTVNLQVTAALTSQRGGFNFNGGSDGSQTITVPQGWTVRMHVKNVDAIPHSAILILDQKPLPNAPETPAISRAYTSHVSDGLPAQTGQDDVEFRASKPGNYLIYCGVPGHGPSGMYIRFVVSADATTPSYSM